MSAGGVPACLAAAGMKWFWNVRSAWGIAIPVLLPVLELVSESHKECEHNRDQQQMRLRQASTCLATTALGQNCREQRPRTVLRLVGRPTSRASRV